MESFFRHNLYYQLVLTEFKSTVLTFCLHKAFHKFRGQNLCSSLWLSFCSQAGQTLETIYLVTSHCMCSTGTAPSWKNLAAIQLPVEILPWFYVRKAGGAKLFSFSTRATYQWDYSHCYSNNSSVIKNLEAYNRSVWTNSLSARVKRSVEKRLPPLCSCPCPFWHRAFLLPSLCRIPWRESTKWPDYHCPIECVLATFTHTHPEATYKMPISCWAPCTNSVLTARADFCLKFQL